MRPALSVSEHDSDFPRGQSGTLGLALFEPGMRGDSARAALDTPGAPPTATALAKQSVPSHNEEITLLGEIIYKPESDDCIDL